MFCQEIWSKYLVEKLRVWWLHWQKHQRAPELKKRLARLLITLLLPLAVLLMIMPFARGWFMAMEVPQDLYLELAQRVSMSGHGHAELSVALRDGKIDFEEYFRIRRASPIDGKAYAEAIARGEQPFMQKGEAQ